MEAWELSLLYRSLTRFHKIEKIEKSGFRENYIDEKSVI